MQNSRNSPAKTSSGSAGHAPLLTVVTVVKNALPHLMKTHVSLQSQKCRDYEWLVVDGVSNDGTLEWLAGLDRERVRFVSGKDKSIYDAMNKSVGLVGTDYCIFLNAGDTLHDEDVIGRIVDVLEKDSPSFAYGKFIIEANPGFPRRERGHRIDSSIQVFYGKVPCHQAMIFAKRLFAEIGFYDDSMRIYADREWLIRMMKSGAERKITFLDFPIVNYDPNGFSYHRFFSYWKEYFGMLAKHGNPVEFVAGALGWGKAAAYIIMSRSAAKKSALPSKP
jgi:putative colanic acid biosynthesis glycosyltransferase